MKQQEVKYSWKEYELNNKEVWDWIAWGGLTHECVLRNKDDSVLGVIEYRPFSHAEMPAAPEKLKHLCRGWVMNMEEQYAPATARAFLVLTWNPFKNMKNEVVNTLEEGKTIAIDDMEAYLFGVLKDFAASFPEEAEAKVLKYQEIIDYLTFTLSHGAYHVKMPEIPVDLDYVLSARFQADFSKNLITVGDATFLVLSLPAFLGAGEPTLRRIIGDLQQAEITCRHVQRILFFNEDEAAKERGKRARMGIWCQSRSYIKEIIEEPLKGNFYGYYNNTLIALVKTADYDRVIRYLRRLFEKTREFYLIENFNAKQRWWASIPAHFRAGIIAPVIGFPSLEALLYHAQAEAHHEAHEIRASIEEEKAT